MSLLKPLVISFYTVNTPYEKHKDNDTSTTEVNTQQIEITEIDLEMASMASN